MGDPLNESWDLVPPDHFYEAVRLMNRKVRYLGDLRWDFSALQTMPIEPAFERLVESYLTTVFNSKAEWRGWKLPETTMALPWIVRLMPEIKYIYWVRDPRDVILAEHTTDDLEIWGIDVGKMPYGDDPLFQRAISWKYQAELVKATPKPRHWCSIRFEDFVLRQTETLGVLEDYLGFPLARVPVDPSAVGRSQKLEKRPEFDFLTEYLNEYGNAGRPSQAAYATIEAGNDVALMIPEAREVGETRQRADQYLRAFDRRRALGYTSFEIGADLFRNLRVRRNSTGAK